MTKLKARLREHPLFRMLFALQGNPRICVLTEPLWGIPYNLYAPYVGLYMAALGLSDYRIGLIATFGTFFQMFGALFGGLVTDKLGRRRTTFIFDIISWSIPTLIWMCAQNFWWFFAAVVFNSMWQVTDNAWSCLLVEDCDPKKLVDVYTWVNVSGLLAVFFAPISSLLVGTFSVVPAVRLLYGVTFVMMSTKFVILYKFCTETRQGKVRLQETKNVSMWSMMGGYRHILVQILHSPATLAVLALKVLINITQMINANFFGLYVTRGLGLPAGFVALFPMVRAAVMLLFIFTIQHRLNRMKYRPVMMAGAGLYLLANLLLLLTTGLSLWLLVPYILMDAFSCALLIPRQDSLMVLFVDQKERARTLGLMFVITLGFTSPFGAMVGRMSELDMKLPFVLNTAIFAMILLLVLLCKPLKDHDEKEQEGEKEETPAMPENFQALGFGPADILVPHCDLHCWSVVACDQFTAQPEYWQRVDANVGDEPSALRLILPEAQLNAPDVEQKIGAINAAMKNYLNRNLFQTLPKSLIYLERTQSDGRVRHGLVGMVDLEQYDFTPGSGALIRATEGTVLERIPPRARVRRDAPIELPHVMLLIDDPDNRVLGPLTAGTGAMQPLYSFDLMEQGGHLTGWQLSPSQLDDVAQQLAALATPQAMTEKYGMAETAPLLFAVGDGNHSLATAKACWEEQKALLSAEEQQNHPARYALVEVVNNHDEALQFEPIHRVVFGVDPAHLLAQLQKTYPEAYEGRGEGHQLAYIHSGSEGCLTVPHPAVQLAVGTLQAFLDRYVGEFGGEVDYIHGDEVTRELGAKPGNIGFLLPPMGKEQLFKTVLADGVLPRKTFSMGHAQDKRYYLEARSIRRP